MPNQAGEHYRAKYMKFVLLSLQWMHVRNLMLAITVFVTGLKKGNITTTICVMNFKS